MRTRRPRPAPATRSAFATSKKLLAECGIEVDHVAIYRWVQRFTPRWSRLPAHAGTVVGDRWQVN